MANTRQARKRAKQNIKRNQHNRSMRSEMRTMLKGTLKAIAAGDKAAANDYFKKAASKLDRLGRKRIMHPGTVARLKSRLNAKVKAIAA